LVVDNYIIELLIKGTKLFTWTDDGLLDGVIWRLVHVKDLRLPDAGVFFI
jgi:hypothetical protein